MADGSVRYFRHVERGNGKRAPVYIDCSFCNVRFVQYKIQKARDLIDL